MSHDSRFGTTSYVADSLNSLHAFSKSLNSLHAFSKSLNSLHAFSKSYARHICWL
jgi:hypothetical protein